MWPPSWTADHAGPGLPQPQGLPALQLPDDGRDPLDRRTNSLDRLEKRGAHIAFPVAKRGPGEHQYVCLVEDALAELVRTEPRRRDVRKHEVRTLGPAAAEPERLATG